MHESKSCANGDDVVKWRSMRKVLVLDNECFAFPSSFHFRICGVRYINATMLYLGPHFLNIVLNSFFQETSLAQLDLVFSKDEFELPIVGIIFDPCS